MARSKKSDRANPPTSNAESPRLVSDELEARDDCRYGLSNVAVRLVGQPTLYRVHETAWADRGHLELTILPADGPDPKTIMEFASQADRAVYERLGIYSPDAYRGTNYPPGTLRKVRADQLELVGDWPVVCCRPRPRDNPRPAANRA